LFRFICCILFLFASQFSSGDQASQSFRVIVNAHNSVKSLKPAALSEIFLKKVVVWPDEMIIQPLDLPADSAVRIQFTDTIHQRSMAWIKNYWQQRIFSGKELPPREMKTDEDVIKFVMTHQGAIGYVSDKADLKDVTILSIDPK